MDLETTVEAPMTEDDTFFIAHEFAVRQAALSAAIEHHRGAGVRPSVIVETAQTFYAFLADIGDDEARAH